MIRRREFIAGLGGAVAWPLAARAQQPGVPVVGFLDLYPPRPNATYVVTFRQDLAEAGFVEGKTVEIEYREANYQASRLPALAEELVHRRVAVIVAIDSVPTILAAQAATSSIPIVFAFPGDPIKFGLVASLNRPGSNMTGMAVLSTELTGKQLGLLHEMAPLTTTFGYLSDPRARPNPEESARDILAAAQALGQQAIILEARDNLDIYAAFTSLAKRGASALVVAPHFLFANNLQNIVSLAASHNIPAMYPYDGFVRAGGLMSYNTDVGAATRQIGSFYVANILKGAKPGDLPVQQPIKFALTINLKTAKALGLTVPPNLLAVADEVIEE
jgi:putative tryptophan/tyrosine transport system substrate-binding protein